jgi:hypothetical protein
MIKNCDLFKCPGQGLAECSECMRRSTPEDDKPWQWHGLGVIEDGKCIHVIKIGDRF